MLHPPGQRGHLNAITGEVPPSKPLTAQYTKAGFPWFDYYDSDLKAVEGSKNLANLKTVKETAAEKRAIPLPDNQSVSVVNIVNLRSGLKRHQVREADFST